MKNSSFFKIFFCRYYLNQENFIIVFDDKPHIVSVTEVHPFISNQLYSKHIMLCLFYYLDCIDENNASISKYCVTKEIIFHIEIIILIFYIFFSGTCCFYRHYRFYLELRVMLSKEERSIVQYNSRGKRK